MILHHVDSNSSWLGAIQNQSSGELILAHTPALARMQRRGLIPKHQILNNQASAEYKATIKASGMTYELVPPEEHRCNMAEKSHSNLQGSLCRSPQWSRPIYANPPMVSTSPTGQTAAPPSSTILCTSKPIAACTCLRTP
jgi:hypothetical protein